jgi:hypothetical protein
MQSQHASIENNSHVIKHNPSGGAIGGVIARVFGCWHREMSRPFSSQGQTYRTCLDCGARRQFNLGRWEMQGEFYYREPPNTQVRRLAA